MQKIYGLDVSGLYGMTEHFSVDYGGLPTEVKKKDGKLLIKI